MSVILQGLRSKLLITQGYGPRDYEPQLDFRVVQSGIIPKRLDGRPWGRRIKSSSVGPRISTWPKGYL